MNGEQYTAMSVFNQLCFSRVQINVPVSMFNAMEIMSVDEAFTTAPTQELINY